MSSVELRHLLLVSAALLAGCEQILGITDPRPASVAVDARNQGDGNGSTGCVTVPTFGAKTIYSIANAAAIAVGDLDHNGVVDVAVTTGSDVIVFDGAGGGTLGAVHPLASTATPAGALLITDLDGNGFDDVVAWGFENQSAGVVRRQSATIAGTFLAAQPIAASVYWAWLAPKLNADLAPDLVIDTGPGTGITPLFARAGSPGVFDAGVAFRPPAGGISQVVVSDVDDVVLSGIQIFFNHTATPGTFDVPAMVGTDVYNIAVGRFSTNAPRKDLIAKVAGGCARFTQTAARTFNLQTPPGLPCSGPFAGSPATAFAYSTDLNRDGRDDVADSSGVTLQCPNATFGPRVSLELGISRGVLADLNGDGKPDLISLEGLTGIAVQLQQ